MVGWYGVMNNTNEGIGRIEKERVTDERIKQGVSEKKGEKLMKEEV